MKQFLKKFKKSDSFKGAGPGRRLCDTDSPTSKPISSTSTSSPSSSNRSSANPSEASIAAREAALRRLENANKKPAPKSGVEKLLEQERLKAKQELAALSEIKQQVQKMQIVQHPIDQKQKYVCPDLDITIGLSKPDLLQKMQQIFQESIEDPQMLGAMLIKNCNSDSVSNSCISTLELILNNLKTTDVDKLEKFKRVKRVKIEQKILNCTGGELFLKACGFDLDETKEWFVLDSSISNLTEHADNCLGTLAFAEKATVQLDRQFMLVDESKQAKEQKKEESEHFYELQSEDLKKRQQELNFQKDIQETLMSKQARDNLTRTKAESQHTNLLISYQNVNYSIMFRVDETVSDLIFFLINQFNLESFDDHKILYLNRPLPVSDYERTFKDLEMCPTVLLRIL